MRKREREREYFEKRRREERVNHSFERRKEGKGLLCEYCVKTVVDGREKRERETDGERVEERERIRKTGTERVGLLFPSFCFQTLH